MSKITTKKLKVVATLASIALFATAFTPGGCTINIDQDLLNRLALFQLPPDNQAASLQPAVPLA